jgi:glycosyltransferase involved in cell wall biosynthesis
MTRLLVITPLIWNLAEGSGMPSAFRTLAGLRDAGFEVHVLMPASRPWPDGYEGFHLHTYRVPRFGLHGEFGPTRSALLVDLPEGAGFASLRWKAYLGTASLLGAAHGVALAGRIKPSIVYGMMPVGAVAASAVGWFTGTPNVTRLFGTMLADMPRHAWARNLWEIAAYKAPADLWVLVDDGSFADVVAQRHGVPPGRIRHLLNGVDEAYFEPWGGASAARIKASLDLPPDSPLLLCAHQLLPWHHQEELITAMRLLDERGVPGVAVLAGDGPDRPRLEALVADGMKHRVRLLGNVSRDRVRELMAASTAIVSLDDFSNVVNSVLEGLAMGVPIIATATGTTTRLLTHERDSLIVDELAVDELVGALERLLTEAPLRARLARGARQTAEERLDTWDSRIAREAAILRELVAN